MPASPDDVRPIDGPPSLTIADGVARLRLNRPARHNRLDSGDIDTLDAAVAQVDADTSARVLVLSADGPSMCAGYDLAELAGGGGPEDGRGIGRFAGMLDRLETCRVPTICALNGPVYGGGTDLALACDLRIGVAQARMFMPATRFGLHYYAGGLRRYVTRLAPGAAKRLFLLGETIDAAEMHRIFFLHEVVPDLDALHARVAALIETVLAATSAAVVESMKQVLTCMEAGDMDPAQADAAWTATRRSAEVATAVARAREARRRPA